MTIVELHGAGVLGILVVAVHDDWLDLRAPAEQLAAKNSISNGHVHILSPVPSSGINEDSLPASTRPRYE